MWGFAARAAISIALLWLTLRRVPAAAIVREIGTVDRLALLIALLILLTATFVAAVRWSVILRALGTPRSPTITYPLSLIGLFFAQALPGGIGGDVIRVWLACGTDVSMRVAISSILGDRLTGFLAILLIVTLELPVLHTLSANSAIFAGVLITLVAGYAVFAAALALDRCPRVLHRFRLVRTIAGVSADLRGALFSRPALPVLPCGVLIQLGNVLAVFTLAHGLHLPLTFGAALLIVPLANVVQSLPISIAGWGMREGFFVAAFGMAGFGAADAVAVSVLFGLLVIVSSLPGGVIWLFQSRVMSTVGSQD